LTGTLAALVFGSVAGYVSTHGEVLFGSANGPARPPATPSARHGAPTTAASSSSRTEGGLADEVKAINARLDRLAQQMDSLQEKLASVSQAESSSNLTALQVKVAELCSASTEVGPLATRLERNEGRIEQLNAIVATVQAEISNLQTRSGSSPSSGGPPSTSGLPAMNASVRRDAERHEASKPVLDFHATELDGRAFERGAELFKKGKYQEAFDAFSRLELSNPDDARVWYYAALSRGFATDHWGNGTEQLVERGIERERAGTPNAADIDNAFRNLTSATGKDWLAAYRKRVKKS
jgi:TolA-binding protein